MAWSSCNRPTSAVLTLMVVAWSVLAIQVPRLDAATNGGSTSSGGAAESPTSRALLSDGSDDCGELVVECDWRQGHDDCSLGYSCIPYTSDTVPLGTGVCVQEPAGGSILPPDLGVPVMYFPLTGRSLEAWPPQQDRRGSGGVLNGSIAWSTRDDSFPYSMWCDQSSNTLVGIEGLTYGRSGAFSISLWMRKAAQDPKPGGDYEFVFSHTPLSVEDAGASGFTPNDPDQLELYLLPRSGPLAGVMRSVAKASDDQQEALFMDSDGYVNDTARHQPAPGSTDLLDGYWHMVTLTSQPSGGRGFRLYVDGQMVNEMPNAYWPEASGNSSQRPAGAGTHWQYGRNATTDQSPAGARAATQPHLPSLRRMLGAGQDAPLGTRSGSEHTVGSASAALDATRAHGRARRSLQELLSAAAHNDDVDGGGPLSLSGPLLLCGRYDNAPNRAYEGGIAHLMVFDAALQEDQVRHLYMYAMHRELASLVKPIQKPTGYGSTTAQDPTWTFPLPPTIGYNPDDPSLPTAVYNVPGGELCSLDTSTVRGLRFCASGLVCAPDYNRPFYMGSCSPPAGAMLLPSGAPARWPAPMAHFPLTGRTLDSWPGGRFGLDPVLASSDFGWEDDARFGAVLSCNKSVQSRVFLESVPYAANGHFSINVWLKTTHEQMAGSGFEYFFSHTSVEAANGDLFKPNNVHLFMPELGSEFYGVSVRAVLRDSSDSFKGRQSQVWLDSNGRAGAVPGAEVPDDGVDIGDGEWHMVTLTTLPVGRFKPGPKGYALYLDGILRARLENGTLRTDGSGSSQRELQTQITGGFPANLSGPIVLCGRSDLQAERFFSGQLAGLTLWDVALTETDVAQLLAEYQRSSVLYPGSEFVGLASAAVDVPASEAVGRNGGRADDEPCVFPFSYGATLFYECAYIGGTYGCPSQEGEWRPCRVYDGVLQQVTARYIMADGMRLVPTPQTARTTIGMDRLPALTVGGQECRLPIMTENGTSWCKPAGADQALHECAPRVVRPPEATTCGTLEERGAPAALVAFTTCVNTLGVDACQTPEGPWVFCPPLPRVTESEHTCSFPITVEGMVRTDCYGLTSEMPKCPSSPADSNATAVMPAPSFASGSNNLQLEKSFMMVTVEECIPLWPLPPQLTPAESVRTALDGQPCMVPEPGVASECVKDAASNGTYRCEVASGQLLECAGMSRVGAATGASCSFPFVYRGVNRTDCTWLDGVQACKLADGSWEECSEDVTIALPDAPPGALPRITMSGIACSFPFYLTPKAASGTSNSTMGPQLIWDCVRVEGKNGTFCPVSPGGPLEQCMDWAKDSGRTTTGGLKCVGPFLYQGQLVRGGCTHANLDDVSSEEVCLDEEGNFDVCVPDASVAVADVALVARTSEASGSQGERR